MTPIIMNKETENYIKEFCKMSIYEQLCEMRKNPTEANYAIEYLNQQLMNLGNMALTSGTSEYKKYEEIYHENKIH